MKEVWLETHMGKFFGHSVASDINKEVFLSYQETLSKDALMILKSNLITLKLESFLIYPHSKSYLYH